MIRKILLTLIAICCAAQTWAMVSPDGEQILPESSEVQMGDRTEPDYLTITATSDNTRIYLIVHGSPNLSTFQYSYNDGVTWTNITKTTTFNTLQDGQCIKFRSSNQVTKNDVDYINFADNRNCSYKVSGNINTLINYNAVENVCIGDSCFYSLFYGCKGLTDASELSLPAYSLTDWCYYFMFKGCTNLTAAPELPADILADCCYAGMFSYCQSLCTAPVLHATNLAPACYGAMFMGCISLIEAPVLPATTLAEECYSSMFYDCISLIEAPALPATILAEECYASMFYRCTSLTEAPVLPAATLAKGCYYSMFSGCTSLTEAPALIATTLSTMCYYRMFSGCTSLTEAPALPATTLTIQCYEDMFWGCTSLTEAPVLPATTLASRCYIMMFENCTSLTSVTTHATTWNTSDAAGWLWGVATTGDFYNLGGADIPTGTSGIPTGWTEHGPRVKTITAVPNDENYGTVSGGGSYLINETCTLSATPNTGYTFVNWTENDEIVSTDAEYSFTVENDRNLVANFDVNADYLTFTALENNTIIGLDVIGSPNISTLQYSYDGKNWNNITETMMFNTLQTGEYIKFRSENQVSNSYDNYIRFKDNMMSGAYIVSGNINTLINYLDVDNAVIGVDAFIYLFISCSHLTNATSLSLPATTLAWGCYKEMFGHCTSLTEAPELPATTLAGNCYDAMFFGCTSLSEAPELPATTLNVFCYSDMFRDCISLTEAPELPATTLAYECYNNMFSGCTSLNSVTTHATTWNYNNTLYWLSGVSATGDFYNLGGADIPTGISGIPTGWTVHNPTPITITASANNSDFGIVSGGGTFAYGAVATVTATPNSDYTFVKWTENDEIVSTDAEYSFTVETDRNLVAIFVATMDYLTLTALEDNTIIGLEVIGSPNISTLQYSYDGENWNNITNSLTFNTLQNGQYIKFRSENQVSYDIDDNYINFNYINFRDESGSYKVSGNINTLVNYVNVDNVVLADYAFHNLFYGCLGLTDASELLLPCNFLAEDCYSGMFTECSSLIHAPVLPATTLAEGCYGHMFEGCSSLTTAPELPATTLATYCYSEMFQGCTSLTTAPELPATTLADYCYVSMFFFCESLTDAPELPATTLTKGCYASMFRDCRLLTEAPELPATTLTDGCYASMFSGCSSLTEAPELPATMLTPECYFEMFSGCSSLTETPELPATTLAGWCYGSMFFFCESLTDAPQLPATTLTDGCYTSMFKDCRSLTEAPALPATTLTEQCYASMFSGCSSLTEVPELPATTLTPECYFEMFSGCSSLTETPELPATALANGCYNGMFSGCTSLAEAPELPATALANGCYSSMFYGCTSLVTAPELPAANLDEGCYWYMFSGCTSLNSVTTHATTWNSENALYWLSGVSSTGDFYNLGGADIATGTNGIPTGWTEHNPNLKTITAVPNDENYGTVTGNGSYIINETCTLTATPNSGYTFVNWTENDIEVSTDAEYSFTVEADRNLVANFIVIPDYLTLTALEDNTIIGLGVIGSPNISTLQYSYDDENWNNITNSLTFNTLQNGQYIKFRSENQVSNGSDDYISFKDEGGSYKVSGNMSSLINYMDVDNVVLGDYAFNNLFYGCMHLIDASSLSLPATTLTYNCCYYMFRGCTSLTKAPELPATTLANRCYKYMFYDCTSLVEAPELPATTLGFECYYCMFYGCTSLVEAPELPATTLAYSCYQAMFGGCTSLVEAPELPATTLAICCYDAMFGGCTSLAEAPELPATTLASCCYDAMFSGCTSLAEAPELPATTLDVFCYSDMFRDCISLTEAPELPATTLATICYTGMFSGCTSLNSVTTHATTWNTSYAKNWLSGVSATGHFYNLGEADIPTGTSGIPEGWTEHTTAPVTITVSANNANFGTVSGGGSFVEGETCTLSATPNSGYTFVNWTENDIEVSTDAEYSFTVENDRNLVANFEASSSGNHWNPNPYLYADNMNVVAEIYIDNVLQTSSDIEIGAFCNEEVRGSGRVEYEGVPFNKYIVNLTIHGVADDNITFRVFNHQTNEEVSCRIGQSLTFTPNQIEGNLINPYAIECFTTADIVTTVNPSVGGTVSGDGTYQVGQTVTLTATASDYYRFVNWTENDEEVSTSESYSFTAYDDRSLVANFEIYSHWVPDPSLYTYSMTIITEIQVDGMTRTSGILRIGGREQDYNEIEVGAFCGDEIRGSAMLTYMPEPIDKFMVSIVVYGEENDNIAFRLYNHETATEYNLNAPEPIPFVPNATLGSFDEPYVLNFLSTVNISASTNPVEAGTITGIGDYAIGSEATLTAVPNDGFAFKNWTNNGVVVSTETSYSFTADDDGVLVANFDYLQSKELAAGWNWYSTYVAVSGEEGFNMLTANLGTSADVIKSQTNMSMYYDEYNVWSGSLTTIDNMQMYMIKMNTSDELEIVGGLADLAGTQLTLHPGWNWISFPSNVETSLTDALAGFTPDDGDCIKSQFNMALYYGGEYNVWNGSLNKLTPGQGFMYKNNSSSIKVLTYSTAGSKYITDVNITTDGNHWQPNIHAYPDNINITAVVSVNGTEQASENMEVGVFSGGECRGSGRLVYNEMAGRYVTYLTVYGNEGDNLSFRLYDASKDEEYQDAADCSLTFEPNLILGDLRNPFAINFGYDVVFQDDMASFSVYPNPAKVNSVIRLGENCDDVKVINSLGVVVKGYTNTDRIEGFDLAGIYYLVITKGNSIVYSKIIVE